MGAEFSTRRVVVGLTVVFLLTGCAGAGSPSATPVALSRPPGLPGGGLPGGGLPGGGLPGGGRCVPERGAATNRGGSR